MKAARRPVQRVNGRMMGRLCLAALCAAFAFSTVQAQTRDRDRRLTAEELDQLQHKHPGLPGALDPANLAKPRPKAPFDMTGTWFVDLSEGFNKFMFGPPYPEFYAEGQKALTEGAAARARGENYRDSIGQCYPAGMPMIMTRVWPIMFVQLPTVVYMVAGFTNSFRAIYLDGRTHTDPDIYVPTYNGESIGKWEGDTLVVTSKGFETDHHWIDVGLPISEDFQIVERIRMINSGNTLEIEYIMTDPKMWKGEWRNTKRWDRVLESDIGEVECTEARNANLPGTDRGQEALDETDKQQK
ncbi:MAG TPA: hypothetical protein VFF84_13865 [Sphingobium sp.]|nr:hypothetical protein [Sphingobium sp.]